MKDRSEEHGRLRRKSDHKELEFEVLDEIDTEEGHFYALLPTFEVDGDDDGYYILKEEAGESEDEFELAEVEDEALLEKLAAIFEEHFDSLYGDEEN